VWRRFYGHRSITGEGGKFCSAIVVRSYYDRAIECDKKYARAYNNRGHARAAIGDEKSALSDFNHAIKLDPRRASAYSNRGNLRFARGDFDGAIADHNRAIELDPRLAESYNNRANARYAKGDYDAALADYDRALALDPRNAGFHANRGMLHLWMGRRAEADTDFAQSLKLKPDTRSSLEQRIKALHLSSSQYSRLQKWYKIEHRFEDFTDDFAVRVIFYGPEGGEKNIR